VNVVGKRQRARHNRQARTPSKRVMSAACSLAQNRCMDRDGWSRKHERGELGRAREECIGRGQAVARATASRVLINWADQTVAGAAAARGGAGVSAAGEGARWTARAMRVRGRCF
jgi:hypothetical protein